jgi:hypothetical protein
MSPPTFPCTFFWIVVHGEALHDQRRKDWLQRAPRQGKRAITASPELACDLERALGVLDIQAWQGWMKSETSILFSLQERLRMASQHDREALHVLLYADPAGFNVGMSQNGDWSGSVGMTRDYIRTCGLHEDWTHSWTDQDTLVKVLEETAPDEDFLPFLTSVRRSLLQDALMDATETETVKPRVRV